MDVNYRPLILAFVLTALATACALLMPSARELAPFALLLDLVPFGGVLAATVIVALRLRRVPMPRSRLLTAIYGHFAGALIGALGVAHMVAVVLVAIGRTRPQQFVYDFRFYSLVLLGMLLIVAGFIATIEAARLARGDRAAWRASLSAWTAILAINLPLVSLQRFAILFTVLAALELLLLAGIRRQFDAKSSKET